MFTLNTRRTYAYPVSLTVYDEAGKEHTGQFTATFKVLPQDTLRTMPADTLLLDQVLVGASGIEVPGEDGETLAGEALLHALKNDPAASTALIGAYQESVSKKNRPRI